MNNAHNKIDQVFIKIQGTNLAPEFMGLLYYVAVENSLYLPSMCTLRFYDDDFKLMDNAVISLGSKIEIAMAGHYMAEPGTVFQGEITALEPEFTEDSITLFVVRGYDMRHRLNQRHTRTFLKQTDTDIVRKILQEAGIAAGALNATSSVRDHLFQDNQTDLAFIQMLALRNGFELSVEGEKVNFRKRPETPPIELRWRETLRSFRPRVTLVEQVKQVEVRSWDRSLKKPVVANELVSGSIPSIGLASQVTKAPNFAASKHTEGRIPIMLQSEATKLAASLAYEIGASFAEAEGTALGDSHLMPGTIVKIGNIGQRFGGSYTLTSTRHMYTVSGYDTHFTIEGLRPQQVSDLVGASGSRASGWQGVAIGIVTDTNDPNNQNRIKVKFPTLTEDLSSTWAPVTAMGAGADRGIQWLPEVNDEVLVAFEFGDINSPFVIGSLWNGKDKPAQPNAVVGGITQVRTLKTRIGHLIRMIDADGNGMKKGIEIVDSTGKYKIIIDATTGEISIESGGKITIKATTDLDLSGVNVSVTATKDLKLEATGITTLKGQLVNIN